MIAIYGCSTRDGALPHCPSNSWVMRHHPAQHVWRVPRRTAHDARWDVVRSKIRHLDQQCRIRWPNFVRRDWCLNDGCALPRARQGSDSPDEMLTPYLRDGGRIVFLSTGLTRFLANPVLKRSHSAPPANWRPLAGPCANAPRWPTANSPPKRPTLSGWSAKTWPTKTSPRGCSSARARLSGTWARFSRNLALPRVGSLSVEVVPRFGVLTCLTGRQPRSRTQHLSYHAAIGQFLFEGRRGRQARHSDVMPRRFAGDLAQRRWSPATV